MGRGGAGERRRFSSVSIISRPPQVRASPLSLLWFLAWTCYLASSIEVARDWIQSFLSLFLRLCLSYVRRDQHNPWRKPSVRFERGRPDAAEEEERGRRVPSVEPGELPPLRPERCRRRKTGQPRRRVRPLDPSRPTAASCRRLSAAGWQ